jgi:hypothetical protein
VRGSGNTLQAEMQPRSRIDVEGEGDVVNWFLSAPGPRPFAEVSGQGSVVREQQRLGTVIAPPSPVPSTDLADPNGMPPLLVVPGEGPQERDCAGRDAVVQGDDATFVLRGACRTLTVQGSNDRVMAELAGGSRIKIVGSNTHVQFALLGPGPDPIVSVNGEGSNAWRVQRLGSEAGGGVGPTPEGMRVRGGPGAAVKEMPAVPQPVGPDVGPP